MSGEKRIRLASIDPQLWVREWRRLHPYKPTAIVAERLCAPIKTVEKWFAGAAAPSLSWIGAIFSAYGAAFVVAGMRNPPRWLSDAARRETLEHLIAERRALEAEIAAVALGEEVGP